MRSILILITFLLSSIYLYSGDTSSLNFIGFSKSGKYLAFEVYGTQDGSGFPYGEIYIVKVPKNSYAIKPIKLFLRDDQCGKGKMCNEDDVRKKLHIKTRKQLKKYGIVKGNFGTKLSIDKLDKPKLENSKKRVIYYNSLKYILTLQEITANKDKNFDIKLKKFILSLKHGKKTKILQKDKVVPSIRGSVFEYDFNSIYTYNGGIAIFLDMKSRGFEGADTRQMVVTGTLIK